MMEIISNPLYVSYLTLIVALLTAIRVFVPGGESSAQPTSASKAAPVAAPAAPAAVAGEDEEAIVAAITAALSLYAGSDFTIRSIRPAAGSGNLWVSAGRLENTSSL